MSYIDNEILERLIGTMVEGFARIEKKAGSDEPSKGMHER